MSFIYKIICQVATRIYIYIFLYPSKKKKKRKRKKKKNNLTLNLKSLNSAAVVSLLPRIEYKVTTKSKKGQAAENHKRPYF